MLTLTSILALILILILTLTLNLTLSLILTLTHTAACGNNSPVRRIFHYTGIWSVKSFIAETDYNIAQRNAWYLSNFCVVDWRYFKQISRPV